MLFELIKLGSTVTDSATATKCCVTHAYIRSDLSVCYQVKPKGLNKTSGAPLKGAWRSVAELRDYETENREIPAHILGETAKSTASGFIGVVSAITLHLNGCVHVDLAPKVRDKDGELRDWWDFSILEIEGKNIPKFDAAAREHAKKETPSPCVVARPSR